MSQFEIIKWSCKRQVQVVSKGLVISLMCNNIENRGWIFNTFKDSKITWQTLNMQNKMIRKI